MNAHLLWPPASLPKTLPALVLSHEVATAAEMQPFLQEAVRPLRPLLLYARAAGFEPKCHKQEGVYYCWRDHKWLLIYPSLAPAVSAPCLTRIMCGGRSYT